jgi:hypothetical protein
MRRGERGGCANQLENIDDTHLRQCSSDEHGLDVHAVNAVRRKPFWGSSLRGSRAEESRKRAPLCFGYAYIACLKSHPEIYPPVGGGAGANLRQLMAFSVRPLPR